MPGYGFARYRCCAACSMLSHVSGSGGPDTGAVARAHLRADVDDDQLLDALRPLGGEVHRVATPHRESDENARGQAELVDDARDVVEGGRGGIGIGRIAVAVAARVESVDVNVGLQRDAERVPRVRMPR